MGSVGPAYVQLRQPGPAAGSGMPIRTASVRPTKRKS